MAGFAPEQIERVLDASRRLIMLLGERLTEEETLRRALAMLRGLLGARYGAIALADEHGQMTSFLQDGLSSEDAARIGVPPRGSGLLGAVVEEGIRLTDLARDPRHSGFPPHHPPMGSLLGVAIKGSQRTYGRLYMAEKESGAFGDEDAALVKGFASCLGVALDNLQLQRARADFLAMLTHDINGPLNVIFGYMEILRDDPSVRCGPDGDKMLIATQESAQRILHLVQNFLLATRLDAGELRLVFDECDLNSVVEKVAARYRRLAGGKGVRIDLDRDEGRCVVPGNAEALDRLFSNLVTNAVKHSPPGERVQIRVRGGPDFASVSVIDHGPGIAPADRPLLFQRYGRLHGPQHLGGTGLGLYIVKAITQAHGGNVDVESGEGPGATFTVKLPCARRPATDVA